MEEQRWRSREHVKGVVVKVVADHPEGFRIQTRGSREREVCVILRHSEKHRDPLVYPFSSFPSPEHIFLCWRLIYISGSILPREQVLLWDETPWETECTCGKKVCHSTARQREDWVIAMEEIRVLSPL